MIRIAALTIGTAGLLFTAWLDDPNNYSHDALLPTTTAAANISTTGAVVVATSPAPQATPTTSITVTATTRLPSTVPTTSIALPPDARCSEWWVFAATWWPDDELATLDRVMWNESRCQPDAISRTNDYGLLQINWATWSTFVTELGYTRDQLLNPAVNLLVGRLIALEAEKLGWCTFQPWHMSGGYGC